MRVMVWNHFRGLVSLLFILHLFGVLVCDFFFRVFLVFLFFSLSISLSFGFGAAGSWVRRRATPLGESLHDVLDVVNVDLDLC